MKVTMQYLLILVLSLLSIASVIMYWIKSEYRRYKIYIMCGARRSQVVFLLCMNIFYLVTFTFAVAHLLTFLLTILTPPGIVKTLPLQLYGVIYVGILAMMLLMVNVRSVSIIFSSKISLK